MIRQLRDMLFVGTVAVLGALPGLAQSVSVEEARLGASQVRLHLHPFLSPEEAAVLRQVMTNEQALALFVPNARGFAALAAAPGEGVFRDGKPVASAVAIADLPDAAAAALAAREACDKARRSGPACVVVLEVASGK